VPPRIKNCGLTTPSAIACAVSTSANFVGFVHHTASPRHLTAEQIAALYAHVPPGVACVIVLVDPSDDMLASLPKPDFWQITGVSDPARIAAIHAATGVPVITAIRVRSAEDIAPASALEAVSAHLLFDTYHPQEAGGTGHAFDWSLLKNLSLSKPWFLAGGLNADNVADAIRRTHAPMVDVSSGLEDAPGIKSLEKIAAFNKAVLEA
jgi:phosphoribosylanthranilate isomerase